MKILRRREIAWHRGGPSTDPETSIRDTSIRDTSIRDTLYATLYTRHFYTRDTSAQHSSVLNMMSTPKGERWRCPQCSMDCAFSQRRRHCRTHHRDTNLVSILTRTDTSLAKRGHTFKRENRSFRF